MYGVSLVGVWPNLPLPAPSHCFPANLDNPAMSSIAIMTNHSPVPLTFHLRSSTLSPSPRSSITILGTGLWYLGWKAWSSRTQLSRRWCRNDHNNVNVLKCDQDYASRRDQSIRTFSGREIQNEKEDQSERGRDVHHSSGNKHCGWCWPTTLWWCKVEAKCRGLWS